MKKIVTVIALALISSGAFAQFNQGRILAGGSLAFSALTLKSEVNNTTNTIGKQTNITFNPKVGYFFIDNLAAGLSIDLTGQTTKYEGSSGKDGSTIFTVGPFVRYYLDQGLFFQGQVGFGSATSKNATGNTTTTTKYGASSWDLGVGYAYFLNDHVAIEPLVYYGMASRKNKDTDSKSTAGGIGVQIGLQVYLGERN